MGASGCTAERSAVQKRNASLHVMGRCYWREHPLWCEAPAEGRRKTDFGTNGIISPIPPACVVLSTVLAYGSRPCCVTAQMQRGKTVWVVLWSELMLCRVTADSWSRESMRVLIKWESGQKYPLELYLYNCSSNHSDSISSRRKRTVTILETNHIYKKGYQNSWFEQLYC